MTTRIEFRSTSDVDAVWATLIDIYAEVRADELHQLHYSVERYAERLARHASAPGWEATIGYDSAEPVGYVYVNTVQPGDRWWTRMAPPLPDKCSNIPTVVLREGMLRRPWRGMGLGKRGHDELLANRPEEQVSLLVNPLAGNGKVQRLYEAWGYEAVSTQQPSPDGPVLTAMLRAVRATSARSADGVSVLR
ncbi:GNAT family N-acetyltransferase [Streptomyces uncialis]|uniref:GNAT family N-acetyltransferase n=1 Tax=Streptomyces uncialis TaxID=1048205 RepID=UPI0022530608|nr:GNAT family N-acetyltransferase [Streptomyces uncialis]MCX4661127.1 GNAT family N-acetyltransferase [Streptomyces uncialis]WST69059.1 GNAT family N-acetyltransferase [Streptomyces uncialis]